MNAVAMGADLERALQCRNHRSVTEHLLAVWKKNRKNIERQKYVLVLQSAAHEIPNLRV